MEILERIVYHHHSRKAQIVAAVRQILNRQRLRRHGRLHGRKVDPRSESLRIERPYGLTVDLQAVESPRETGNLEYFPIQGAHEIRIAQRYLDGLVIQLKRHRQCPVSLAPFQREGLAAK